VGGWEHSKTALTRKYPHYFLSMSKSNVRACLAGCGITSIDTLSGCQTTEEEFGRVKKSYLKLVLSSHPDKGGNAEDFIALREAWDVLRQLYGTTRINVPWSTPTAHPLNPYCVWCLVLS
jgi:hypothetical protein